MFDGEGRNDVGAQAVGENLTDRLAQSRQVRKLAKRSLKNTPHFQSLLQKEDPTPPASRQISEPAWSHNGRGQATLPDLRGYEY